MVMIMRWQIIVWCISEQLKGPNTDIYIKSCNNGLHVETCKCIDYLMMKVND